MCMTCSLYLLHRRDVAEMEGKVCMTCSLYLLHRRDVAEIPCDDVIVSIITQQVVKQTVMTVVYGVTRVGGRLQIAVSSVLHLVPAAWQPHPSHTHIRPPPPPPPSPFHYRSSFMELYRTRNCSVVPTTLSGVCLKA